MNSSVSQNFTRVVKLNSNVNDAVELIQKTAINHKDSQAVKALLGHSLIKKHTDSALKFLEALFTVIYNNTQYEYDENGKEQIKTPDRFLLKDKKGDCDDYSTLLSAVLINVRIKHFIKIVKYKVNGSWAHVYIVVPVNTKNGELKMLSLDLVLAKNGGGLKMFGKEVKYVESKIF